MYVINRFNAHGAMAGDQFTEYTNQKQVINSNEMHNYYDIHKCKLSNKLQIHILHTCIAARDLKKCKITIQYDYVQCSIPQQAMMTSANNNIPKVHIKSYADKIRKIINLHLSTFSPATGVTSLVTHQEYMTYKFNLKKFIES